LGGGGVKKTGTQAVRASHDNLSQYYWVSRFPPT